MKIVYLDESTMGDAPMDEIKSLGEYIGYYSSSKEEAIERVADCDVLLVNKVKVDAELMAAAPNLKLICVCATGTNNIDHEEASKRGIVVRNVAGYSTNAVAQASFTLLLSLIGQSDYFDSYVKDGSYTQSGIFTNPSYHFPELAGKTMGIVGMGAIGSKVASIASAFGMNVIYYSTSGSSHNTDYPSVSLDELLSSSDVVSIHSPLNEKTKNLISEKELGLMKKSTVLLNLGRGGIVNEEALAEAVDNGIIKGAALDVFTQEPLPSSHPFMNLRHPERFRFSPHIAWSSSEAVLRLITMVAENIKKAW